MKVLAAIGLIATVAASASAIYFFGGFFNVAALEPDSSITTWALVKVREASIAKRAPETLPPGLDDAAPKAFVPMQRTSTRSRKLFPLQRYFG